MGRPLRRRANRPHEDRTKSASLPGPLHSPDRRLEIDFKFKIPDSRKEPIAPSPALFESWDRESGIASEVDPTRKPGRKRPWLLSEAKDGDDRHRHASCSPLRMMPFFGEEEEP
jgi:hypothetical protein